MNTRALRYSISRGVAADGVTTTITLVAAEQVEREPSDEFSSGRHVAEVTVADETGPEETAAALRKLADVIERGGPEACAQQEL